MEDHYSQLARRYSRSFRSRVVFAFWRTRRALSNESDQANRAISTGKLNALLRLHIRPINVVVYHGSRGRSRFEVGFPLRCLQRLSRPYVATLHCGWRHNSSTRGTFIPVPLVLGTNPLKSPTPTADRDRTVSRRSEPSSRTTLIGEQPKPLGPAPAPGCDEPTSRCQTTPSIWTLGRHQPVIPRVPFIR